jgi:tRNA (guanine37-N1)-methyltransferase
MRIDIVTIFPQYLDSLRISLIGKAVDSGLIDVHVHDLRDWTHDRHRTVDDTPYGGGPGMVMSPEPWGAALDDVRARAEAAPLLVIPTPSGMRFTQSAAAAWSELPRLVFACGRYEGIDSRVAQHYSTSTEWQGVAEVSIGDYVLAGGEAAALVMVEAVGRLLPGVLGNQESAADDSFAPGVMADLVEGPVFTKPVSWRGLEVPEILLSGHHGRIEEWRAAEAERRTGEMRPDLLS